MAVAGKRKSDYSGGRKKGRYSTVLGYDRAAGGLTASSRQKTALARLVAASKETGYIDTAQAAYALDTTGSVTLLNPIPQGAGVTQRVGKKIIMKGLQCRGNLTNNNSGLLNDVAYMIVYDKRPTGTLPTVTDILVSASAYSMNNDSNSGRFSILKRCDEVLAGNPSVVTDTSMITADWWLDLKSKPVVYKAAGTGAIGDIEEGALYLVTVGITAAGATAASALLAFRMRFLDV